MCWFAQHGDPPPSHNILEDSCLIFLLGIVRGASLASLAWGGGWPHHCLSCSRRTTRRTARATAKRKCPRPPLRCGPPHICPRKSRHWSPFAFSFLGGRELRGNWLEASLRWLISKTRFPNCVLMPFGVPACSMAIAGFGGDHNTGTSGIRGARSQVPCCPFESFFKEKEASPSASFFLSFPLMEGVAQNQATGD